MTTTNSGFALIEIATGAVVADRGSLPCRIDVPGAGVCDFDAVGQIMPDAEHPTHRLVSRVVVDDPPGALYAPTGETIAYDAENDQVVVTKTYPAEPNVTPPVEVIKAAWLAAALQDMGLLGTVEAAIADQTLKIAWQRATEVRRDSPHMIAVATALSIDLDAVWARALELSVALGQPS